MMQHEFEQLAGREVTPKQYEAIEEGKCIRERPYNVKIKLANGTPGTMMRLDGCHPVKGWQPTARELISDSWEVME